MARSPRTRRCGGSVWRDARSALGSPAECFRDGAEEREVWPSSLFPLTLNSLAPERPWRDRLSLAAPQAAIIAEGSTEARPRRARNRQSDDGRGRESRRRVRRARVAPPTVLSAAAISV